MLLLFEDVVSKPIIMLRVFTAFLFRHLKLLICVRINIIFDELWALREDNLLGRGNRPSPVPQSVVSEASINRVKRQDGQSFACAPGDA